MINVKTTALSFLYWKYSENHNRLLKASSLVHLVTWQRSLHLVSRNLSSTVCKEWQRQILALLAINISNIHLISCFRFTSLLAETYS